MTHKGDNSRCNKFPLKCELRRDLMVETLHQHLGTKGIWKGVEGDI